MLIEAHPQRAEVIQMLTDPSQKRSLRQIAASLKPPVHVATLSRFRVRLIGSAAADMRGKQSNVRAIRDLASLHGGEKELDALRARIKNDLHSAVKKGIERRAKWIDDAETYQTVDYNGVVHHNMNHTALAAHDRNSLNALEFTAKLHGLLQDESQRDINVQAVVVLPQPAALPPAETPQQVLEADFEQR